MAERRRYDLDELLIRPGTYFNPQTEVLLIVDDSPSIDQEIFNMEEFEGADWVLITDDLPVDEPQRDEALETFQATFHGGDGRAVVAEDDVTDLEGAAGDEDDDEDPLPPADEPEADDEEE